MTASLLPPNATPLERALEASTARVAGVPVPMRSLVAPATCPAPLLPWLAWAEDVPVWNQNWSERMKRGIIAASWNLHRRAGTLGALKSLAQWAGCTVLGAVTPPAKRFAGASMTKAERNAWLSRFPQLRIYRYRTRGHRIGAMTRKDFAGAAYPVRTDADLRVAPRAYLWRDGQEAALVCEERVEGSAARTAATMTEVHQPGTARFRGFACDHPHQLPASTARERIYVLRRAVPYQEPAETLRKVTVQPGLDPVDVHVDQVAERGTAAGIFACCYAQGVFRESTAHDRLYDRIYLFDPSVAPALRGAATFMAGLLGMPPHRAEIRLQVRGHRAKRAVGRFAAGYLAAHDGALLEGAVKALAWGRRASDRVLVNTTTRRSLTAGAMTVAGSARAGALVAA